MTTFNSRPAHRAASGFFPDPSICSTPAGTYLMVNSSFEYFPGIPLFESVDGIHWQRIGDVMSRPSQFPYDSMGNNQGVYAPTIRWHDGRYYVIVTNVNVGTLLYTATDPHGAWSEPMAIPDWPGIDPSLFFDEDGTAYICGTSDGSKEPAGIYAAGIDIASGRIRSPRVCLTRGITRSNPEGPHIYTRGGRYYLVWAEGGTEAGHMENIARAADLLGPYAPYDGNPMLTNRSTELTLQPIGHADCADFEAARSLMVFHGTRNNHDYPAHGWIGREPYAVRFTWQDGWPNLSDQSYDCALLGSGESLEHQVAWITPGRDEDHRFTVSGSAQGIDREDAGVDITVVPDGDGFDLDHGAPFIGTRQTDFDCEFSASFASSRMLERGEYGVVIYANATHYCTCAVHVDIESEADADCESTGVRGGADASDGDSVSRSQPTVRVQTRVMNAGLRSVVASCAVAEDTPVTLRVRGDDAGYHFAARVGDPGHDGKECTTIDLGMVPGKVLSFANAGGFTGTALGVYAQGKGAPVTLHHVRYRAGADAKAT